MCVRLVRLALEERQERGLGPHRHDALLVEPDALEGGGGLEVGDELDELGLDELGVDERLVAGVLGAAGGAAVAGDELAPDGGAVHLALAAFASFGFLYLLTYVVQLSVFVEDTVLVLGLGLSIDFSLFMVTRVRESLAREGTSIEQAITEALQTTGRAITVSGLTVATSLAGLYVTGLGVFDSLATGAIGAALSAVAAALTLTPASLVLLAEILVLTLIFAAPLIALKAVLTTLLSVSAALGIMTFFFRSTGDIGYFVPLFLFATIFGLSTDYEVFLLSRVREHHREGESNTDSLKRALIGSSRSITLAGITMGVVFFSFAVSPLVPFQELGVGMGLAIVLDVTVVRALLVPATVALLGELNWWRPRLGPNARLSEYEPVATDGPP